MKEKRKLSLPVQIFIGMIAGILLGLVLIGKGDFTSAYIKPFGERVFSPGSEAQTRCDLRGKNIEEGILELERYIDQALRLGLGEITVIHGKGTGALRKGIQEYLRKSKYVKSFRLGIYGEGENGVTIVTLK